MLIRYAPWATVLLLVAAGCEQYKVDSPRELQPLDSAPADEPGAPPASNDAQAGGASPQRRVMATVNGQPIYMDALYDLLVRSDGMANARQLIANELVRQEAQRRGVSVSDQEVAEQSKRTLERMFPDIDDPRQLDRLLEQMLVSRGMCRKLWDLTMRRNALLRKLARRNIRVTDAQLRAEYEDTYGRKVQIRHIQTASAQEAQDVLARLAAGEDFAELAKKVSKNASARNGGLLPPLGAKTAEVPPAMRKAALEMNKVGQVSGPIQVGASFHILKLEKIIPAENVDFEAVKDELAEKVRSRQLDLAAQALLREMLDKAVTNGQIRFIDPILKQQSGQEEAKQ